MPTIDMGNNDAADSPFDSLTDTVGDQTADSLELLGNQTRLEILVALWDSIDPITERAEERESGLSFSALYDRVGVEDSGQFNYHLNKLTGKFVDNADGTYTLTGPARRMLMAIIAGAVTDLPQFTDEPVDTDCWLCGESVVIDYTDGILKIRCTNCEGAFRGPDDPPGMIGGMIRPPAGLKNRNPQEFFRKGNVMDRHDIFSMLEGVCPNCMGTVKATDKICDNHTPGDDSLCPNCREQPKITWRYVCDLCKKRYACWGWLPIFTEAAVVSFCYERGLDIYAIWDTKSWREVKDAVETTVSSRDPLEITVAVELEGDRLTMTLDDGANVVAIDEICRLSDGAVSGSG